MRKSKILKQKSSLKSIKEQDKPFSKVSNDTLSKIYSDNNELEQNEEILVEFHEKKFEVFYLNLIELYQKFSENTTNNREEMKAIMWVMCKYGRENPIICSDSNYCVQTFNEWIFNWQRNGWIKASDKKPPENLDILKDYMYLYDLGFRVNLKKVKGHAGNKWNELADKLATGKEVL
jgi:ribonuclease HI